MVNFLRIAVVLLAVLPLLIVAAQSDSCSLSVSQKLSDAGRKYNTFMVTLRNKGYTDISNIVLSSDKSLKSVSSIKSVSGGYTLPSSTNGVIKAGKSYSFTYTLSSSRSVSWTISCDDSASSDDNTSSSSSSSEDVITATVPAAATSRPAATPRPAATTKPAAPAKATTAPVKATTAPAATTKPVATSGTKCASGTWWKPQPLTTWQWQLTGTIDQSINVQMYDIDLFDNTAATIAKLHSAGRVVICYFSTQYEDWRPDASSFTSAVLGSNLDDWAGEKYVDIRSTVVKNIMSARMDLAVSKGCDGIEPDNVDGYQAKNGFSLTAADQLTYNKFLASEAHRRGLSVGLKNDLDQATALQPYFDWALNEQCAQYKECSSLDVFVKNNKAVFNAEYSGSGASVCPAMVTSKFSSIIKSLSLSAAITAQCCTYAPGGCTATAAYTCASSKRSLSLEENQFEEEEFFVDDQATEPALITEADVIGADSSAPFAAYVSMTVVAVAVLALNI